jgi:hypothetical protein
MSNRDNIQKYMMESLEKQNTSSRERRLYNSIPVMIKDFPTAGVDIDAALIRLEQRIPAWCFANVDIVYIGVFDVFLERDVEAVYEDGAIYVFSDLTTTEDFVESVGHEVAHAVEEAITDELYADSALETEFVGKRRRLQHMLRAEGYEYELGSFTNVEYETGFDDFLYKEVGYPVLTALTSGLFMSPYAATSLREYFANGFEWFFLKNQKTFLKQISPMLYYKLDKLSNF